MKKNRPVNLDLRTIKFPPMAIASILHRASGVLLMLFIPLLLYFLQYSLQTEATFQMTKEALSHPIIKVIFWLFLSALIYHLFAGIRHMVMDVGFGESLVEARRSALTVIGLAVVVSLVLGIWLW